MAYYSRENANTFGFIGLRAVTDGTLADLPTISEAPLGLVDPRAPTINEGSKTWFEIDVVWLDQGDAVSYELYESITGSGGSYSLIQSPTAPLLSATVTGFDPEEERQYIKENRNDFYPEFGAIEDDVNWIHLDKRYRPDGKLLVFKP